MSILAALAHAYDRLPDAPPFGFSSEKIGFLISLNEDGTVAHVIDLRDGEGKKKVARQMFVPAPTKRTADIAPNFLWDKSSYVLGVTAGEGKRHAKFVERHIDAIGASTDTGLTALKAFLKSWHPERFAELGWSEDMKDQNIVFGLESERRDNIRIHDRPSARALWSQMNAAGDTGQAICLVSGERAPVARLHQAIKGVWGAQSSGASIVSFNIDAFTSYGHEQGDNAPVSEAATFAYTTALNRFLEKDSGHRLQIGDASTVFWADGEHAEKVSLAETMFSVFFNDEDAEADLASVDEKSEAKKVGVRLKQIREGMAVADLDPGLASGVRFYVLALAPNAARLSVRFWLEDDFGTIARNYQRFISDMRVEPPPRDGYPALWKYLAETAVLKKRENVPPNLAGDWMRAILTGQSYPLTLLATVLMRLRADKDVNALRVGILKSLLIRNARREVPVALDPENTDKGYLLGQLFATYEHVQTAALGSKVNATIKDKFYGSASAQPRKVFALLDKGSANHLSKVGKQSPGRRVNLEKQIGAIMDRMQPDADPFPASLSAEEQALFGLGYYHQRSEFFKSKKDDTAAIEETDK